MTNREEGFKELCLKPLSSHLGLFSWDQSDKRKKKVFSKLGIGCGNRTLLERSRVLQELSCLHQWTELPLKLRLHLSLLAYRKMLPKTQWLCQGKCFMLTNLRFHKLVSFTLALLSTSWLDEEALKFIKEVLHWKISDYIQCWCPRNEDTTWSSQQRDISFPICIFLRYLPETRVLVLKGQNRPHTISEEQNRPF